MCDTEVVVPFWTRTRNSSFLRRVQTRFGNHPNSHSKGPVGSLSGHERRGESFTIHVTLAKQLKIRGYTSSLPPRTIVMLLLIKFK